MFRPRAVLKSARMAFLDARMPDFDGDARAVFANRAVKPGQSRHWPQATLQPRQQRPSHAGQDPRR